MIKLSPEEEHLRIAQRMLTSNIFRRNGMLISLLVGYQKYLTYEKCKQDLNVNISYQDVERILDVLQEYVSINLPPEVFVKSEDQRANELLDAREAFESFMDKNFKGAFRPMVMGFFKQLRYRLKMDHVWAKELHIALSAFHNYAIGLIDREELRQNMIRIDIRQGKTIVVDSMYIRHDAIMFERIFHEVCIKRAARDMKKEGRVLTSFNIEVRVPDEWELPK